jgi:hypothetical protein
MFTQNNSGLEEQLRTRSPRVAPDLAPFVIVYNLTEYQSEVLQHLGLMGDAFEPSELRTRYFSGWIDSSRQSLHQEAEAWRSSIESQGLVLRPIFHGRPAKDDELRVMATGYGEMLAGSSFDKVLQASSMSAADRDLFKKVVTRHMDPGPKYYEFETLGLFAEQAGSKIVQVPRPLLAFAQRCSGLPLTRTALERFFLYAAPDDTKPRDVIQQIGLFLAYLGVIDAAADKFALVTAKSLKDRLDRADDWLKRDFEQAVSEVDTVHRDIADNLRDHYAKMARQQLKEAQKKLDSLDLGFLNEKWGELNKSGSDGNPLYVSRWNAAAQIVSEVRATTFQVFDPEANRGFTYSPDLLPDYESQSSGDDYPLWRRIAILRGFYRDVRDRRLNLERRIQEVRTDAEGRVPTLNGERIFPLQALTLPLDFYRQEINFPSDRPNRTIPMGSTALGVQTVGFKLSTLKYQEVLQRLDQISAELNSPGKLVSIFLESLKEWETVRVDAQVLSSRFETTLQFFADADTNTKIRFQLRELEDEMSEVRGVAEEGLMRSKTDQRESSGTPAFDLAIKLAGDVQDVKPLVSELRALLDGIDNSVTVRLQEDYREKNGALLKAFQKVRIAQNKPPVTLPEKKGNTWKATVKVFEEIIDLAKNEGSAYLPTSGPTTFEDFVKLCEMEERFSRENREIDWEASPFAECVPLLIQKKLLRLKLI